MCGFKIRIAHSIPNPLLMNPTQIYTIPTPNPIPLHMIPNQESNLDLDSSFDSDSGFGIAPGLLWTPHSNLLEKDNSLNHSCVSPSMGCLEHT